METSAGSDPRPSCNLTSRLPCRDSKLPASLEAGGGQCGVYGGQDCVSITKVLWSRHCSNSMTWAFCRSITLVRRSF